MASTSGGGHGGKRRNSVGKRRVKEEIELGRCWERCHKVIFKKCIFRRALKGHCHGNFTIFWSKPFFNMKLLIQHWEKNTKVFLSEEQTIVIF